MGKTRYGPYIFINKLINNSEINLFDHGRGIRDFTYIDDIVDAIYLIVKKYKKVNLYLNMKFIILDLDNQFLLKIF